MADRNGVYKRDKLGKRMHDMRVTTDFQGRRVNSCVKCGAMPVTGSMGGKIVYE